MFLCNYLVFSIHDFYKQKSALLIYTDKQMFFQHNLFGIFICVNLTSNVSTC